MLFSFDIDAKGKILFLKYLDFVTEAKFHGAQFHGAVDGYKANDIHVGACFQTHITYRNRELSFWSAQRFIDGTVNDFVRNNLDLTGN